MALVKLEKDGYGQLELNQVAFRRSGRIEAQCALESYVVKNEKGEVTDSGYFYDHVAENGMLLAVDNVKRVVRPVTANNIFPIALHYSTEHMYDERAKGLKNFCLKAGEFLPRMGYLGAGDKYTTNTVCFDSTLSYETIKTNLAGDTVYYAVASTTKDFEGYHEIVSSLAEGVKPVALVIAATTMPDGQKAFKFQAL